MSKASVIEIPVTNYVDCIKNTRGWRKHTEERVSMASLVTYNMLCGNMSFTRASKMVAKTYGVSYRRLQDYMKSINIVEFFDKRYHPYGKTLVFTIFVSYESSKSFNRSRRFEARLYFTAPLDFLNYDRNFLFILKNYVRDLMGAIDRMSYFSYFLEYDLDKSGIFPFTLGVGTMLRTETDALGHLVRSLNGERELWCNEVFNTSLGMSPVLEIVNLSNNNVYTHVFLHDRFFCYLEREYKRIFNKELYVPLVVSMK